MNLYDKHKAQKRGAGSVELALDELEECIPDTSASIPSEDSIVTECLNSFLKSLPIKHRNIFIRKYFYMASITEIAEFFDLNESTVRVSLKRTRDKLKVFFEKEEIYL